MIYDMHKHMIVDFKIKDPLHFDFAKAAQQLADCLKDTRWVYGMAGFIGDNHSFYIHYNSSEINKYAYAWYHLKQSVKSLFK